MSGNIVTLEAGVKYIQDRTGIAISPMRLAAWLHAKKVGTFRMRGMWQKRLTTKAIIDRMIRESIDSRCRFSKSKHRTYTDFID